MSSRLEGKVALITGAARGQGRSHAIRLAQEGADIIAVDICEQIESNLYPLATQADLDETAKAVEDLDRRIIARKADVRSRDALKAVVEEGVGEFGHLDVVVANAGIMPMGKENPMDFVDATDVDLIGVMNTVAAAVPHLPDGASIVVTGSTAGLMPGTTSSGSMGAGGSGYAWSKKTLVGYVEQMALHLAGRMIRVNAVHPTNCNTDLIHNKELYQVFRPDLEAPTREDVEPAFTYFQAMPIPYVEPVDISHAVLFLVSDESRYVTGQQLRVDAGSLLRWPNGPQA
jgi:SDR family mycofactocin-dependent oxidoreductase